MPGSLLGLGTRVTRHESTHSDRSDASSDSRGSAKKVSFNRAVRVKKFPQRKGGSVDPASNGDRSPSPEKRFWFKVYKNLHRSSHHQGDQNDGGFVNSSRDVYDTDDDSGHFGTLTTISETADTGTQTPNFKSSPSHHFQTEFAPLHPSQMPPEPPRVRKDHVKKIVNKFNEEAVLRVHRDDIDEYEDNHQPVAPSGGMRRSDSPDDYYHEDPPADVSTPSKSRKNPIINGVKVIFGMSNLKKRQGTVETKNSDNLRKSQGTSMRDDFLPNGSVPHHGPYTTHIVLPSKKEQGVQSTGSRKSKQSNGSSNGLVRTTSDDVLRIGAPPPHVFSEKWTSGDQLVLDTNDFHTESEKTDEGQFFKTVGEKHQVWRNETRTIVYEDPTTTTTTRRKAKSYNDLTDQGHRYDDHERTDDYRSDDRGVSTEQLYYRTTEAPSYVNQRESSHRQHRNTTRGASTEQLYFRDVDGPSYVNQRDVVDDVDRKYHQRHQRGTSTEQLHHTSHERRSDAPSYVNQQETNGGSSNTWRKKKHTRDQGVQCGKGVRDPDGEKYRVVRSKEGHGDVPREDSWTGREDTSTLSKNGVIYSQVDKTKKKVKKDKSKNRKEEVRLGSSSAVPSYVNSSELGRDEKVDRKVKSSRSIFGFKLKTSKEEAQESHDIDDRDRNWYDVETDLEAAERSRRGKDVILEDGVSDVSAEASDLYRRNEASTPGSVIREVDYKKREISYENVPRPDLDREEGVVAGGGLWYRDADEDYRREMAQSEVSYPAGTQVGNERYYTIGRVERSPRDSSPSSPPRAYTLDRRHLEEKRRSNNNVVNTSGVKILVNGEEVDDVVDTPKKHSSKGKGHRKSKQRDHDDNNLSSVQSDPLYERGGLAAAYQARQRAAVKRSSSSATPGMLNGYRVRTGDRQQHGLSSSAASGISSSDSDSTRRRRTLVMYIPGVSHQRRQADEGDRVSGASVARSQSMLSASRPTKYVKHGGVRKTRFTEDETVPLASSSESKRKGDGQKNSDIRRRHSMPKDTKFSWLKWKIKGKPSREP